MYFYWCLLKLFVFIYVAYVGSVGLAVLSICLFKWIEEVKRFFDRFYGIFLEWLKLKEQLVAFWDQLKRTEAQLGRFLGFICREMGVSVWCFLTSGEMKLLCLYVIATVLLVIIQLIWLYFVEPQLLRDFFSKCGPLTKTCRASCRFLGSHCNADARRACRQLSGLWHPDQHRVDHGKDIAEEVFTAIRKSCNSHQPCLSLKRLFEDQLGACG